MRKQIISILSLLTFLVFGCLSSSFAATNPENLSAPLGVTKWQTGMREHNSEVMAAISHLHSVVWWISLVTVVIVLVALVYICDKFSKKRNPVASQFTHHTMLEIVWTAIPLLIIAALAVISIKTLHLSNKVPDKTDMTVKIVGHQWFWSYEYPDFNNVAFDSYIVNEKDLKPNQNRLLEVDNPLVVPVNTVIKIMVTADDVIHSFGLPDFGVKIDAVPGRLNQSWFKANRTGVFYGQCFELCGQGHGFMPIKVVVLSKENFAEWIKNKGGIKEETTVPAERIVPAKEPSKDTTAPPAGPPAHPGEKVN